MDNSNLGIICQIIIGITGFLSIWMIHNENKSHRQIACVLALLGQPAWIYAAWKAQQWGILFVDLLSTVAWARGLLLNNKYSNKC